MDKYQKVRVLGKGSFGSAILIKRKQDGALFVVKEVSLVKMSKRERDEARHECTVLQQLNHPNIVRYVEQFENRSNLYIVMEYCDGGDLAQKIKASRGPMKEPAIMFYFSQICLAMEYLHSRHILHRDIKTMNVFLTKNGAVKLGDFGISTVLRNTMGVANTVCGTPYYFSPELCRNKPYNNKSDIWALGVLLYECASDGRHPFDGTCMNQLMQRIVRGTSAPLSSQYTSDFRKMVSWCMQKEPTKRPSIKQILSLPIVRQSLERLEENLMLATQCRVRLKDIIDFETDGESRGQKRTPSPAPVVCKSPRATPRSTSPVPSGLTPGQAAAMAMQQQQRNSQASTPHVVAAVVSPKPISPHPRVMPRVTPYQQRLIADLQRAQQLRAAKDLKKRPPAKSSEVPSPAASEAQPVSILPPPPAVVSSRSNANSERKNPTVTVGDAFQANLKRIDAIIARYGQNAKPEAKETIHAYMRRKQEEYLRRQKEDNEIRERRQNPRLREVLNRILEKRRSPARENRSPRTASPSLASPNAMNQGPSTPKSPRTPARQQLGRDSSDATPQPLEHRNPITGEGITPPSSARRRLVVAANSPHLLVENLPAAGRPAPQDGPRPAAPVLSDVRNGVTPRPTSPSRRDVRERCETESRKQSPKEAHGTPCPSGQESPRRHNGVLNVIGSPITGPSNGRLVAASDFGRQPQRTGLTPRSAEHVNCEGLRPIQRPMTPPPVTMEPGTDRCSSRSHQLALPPVNVESSSPSSCVSSDADLIEVQHGVTPKAAPQGTPVLDALRFLRKKGRVSSSKGTVQPVHHIPSAGYCNHKNKAIIGDAARYAGMRRLPTSEAEEAQYKRNGDNVYPLNTLEALRSLRNNSMGSRDDEPQTRQLALLKQRQLQPPSGSIESNRQQPTNGPLRQRVTSAASVRSKGNRDSCPTDADSGRRISVDSYREMLQHLKDLLEKRKVGHDRAQIHASPTTSPRPQEQDITWSDSDGAISPPSLRATKLPQVFPTEGASGSPPQLSSDDPEDEDDDDDFEDEVPLSPVRCAETNDRNFANQQQRYPKKAENENVYSHEVFLQGLGEEEDETEYNDYKLPSPMRI